MASAVLVFALVSYGVDVTRQTGTRRPPAITVDGKPVRCNRVRQDSSSSSSTRNACTASTPRSGWRSFPWGDTRVVAVPVEQPQYAAEFLLRRRDSMRRCPDFESLKKVFGFTGYPFGVAIQNGRQKAALTKFEDAEPAATLKQLGFIE